MTEQIVKQILVLEEKHGDIHYDASTSELLSRAAVKILKARKEEGYWYNREYDGEDRQAQSDAELLAVTDEELAATPAVIRDDLVAKVEKARKRAEMYSVRKEEEDQWFAALEAVTSSPEDEAWQILDEGQYGRIGRLGQSLAFNLLQSRSDYEYEGLRLVTLR